MLRRLVRASALAIAALAMADPSFAAITRIVGPAVLYTEGRLFFKFDSAFDTTNRVYLVVWGTQANGPVNGLFLNEVGTPIGGVFAVSDGAQQSGWARVIYSAEQGKFLVTYTKILGTSQHQKLARFVTYSGGAAVLSGEIPLDSWVGDAGTETGLVYVPAAQRFLVTWWRPAGLPTSFVAAIDPSGAVVSAFTISNPGDGQSDPEIACDPVNRRCLVVGFAWGIFNGGREALWGRYLDDATGQPQGADMFYFATSGNLEEPTIAFSAAGSRFVVGFNRDGQIWANTATSAGTFSTAYPLQFTSTGTFPQDLGGYGFPTLVYNAGTQTLLLASRAWSGYPVAQEVDAAGAPIPGALDFIPDPGPGFDSRNQYTIPVANPVSNQYLVVDNHFFIQLRVSLYSTGGSPPPPPPPPPPPGPPPPPPAKSIDVVPFNYNGDALKDLLLYNRTTGLWTIQLGDTGTFSHGPSGGWSPGWKIHVANFNGDSFDDLFLYSETSGVWVKVINSGSSFSYFSQGWRPGFTITILDMNADGRSDVFLYDPASGVWVSSLSVGNGTTGFEYAGGGWLPGFRLFPADFDGDGRRDLLLYDPVGGTYCKALTRGNGVFLYSCGGWSGGWVPFVMELNGDGRSDVFLYSFSTGIFVRAVSLGDGTGGFSYSSGGWSPGWLVHVANFDGGLPDLFLYNANGTWVKVINTGTGFTYFSGGWAIWTTSIMDMNADFQDDVLLHNPATGVWFQAVSTSAGGFSYTAGQFPW